MKFKKGAKVEVLTQNDVPSVSWHCAKIICGDGRFYSVKYDGDVELWGKVVFDKVPRKSIRPSPPPVDVLQEWVSGDVIEVFHNFSWKMATVLEVLGCNYLSVRLLGSAIERRVSKFDVRPRLCWQDGEWIVIGKASNQGDDLRFRIPSSRKDYNQSHRIDANVSNRTKDYYVGNRSINNAQEHELLPIRKRRKQSYCYRQSEAYTRPKKKTRLEKQFHVMQQSELPVKVADDVASSQERLHEKCLQPSFVNKVNGCSELIMERDKTDGTVRYSRLICIESDDDNSVSSSVASCSVDRNYSHKLRRVFTTGPIEDNDSQLSDAESFCNLRPKEGNFLLSAKEFTEEVHRLELHAYRCTIAALHASGPLTWEHELLLTNLRQSLHISNDEHLKEIRNLVSATNCLPSRAIVWNLSTLVPNTKDDTGPATLCFGVIVPVPASNFLPRSCDAIDISVMHGWLLILSFGACWSLECLSSEGCKAAMPATRWLMFTRLLSLIMHGWLLHKAYLLKDVKPECLQQDHQNLKFILEQREVELEYKK